VPGAGASAWIASWIESMVRSAARTLTSITLLSRRRAAVGKRAAKLSIRSRSKGKASTTAEVRMSDALLAALKIKLENPEAHITYVRKSNRRGDRRHPHEALLNKKMA
jgi:hypothetical protein